MKSLGERREGSWRRANYGQLRSRKNNNNNGNKKRDAEMTSGNPSENTHTHTHIKETVKNFRKITIATTKLTAGEGSRGRRGKK